MTITLRPLNDAERATMLELQVAPAQQNFVASNEDSIEEADAGHHCAPFAIYADDLPVGYTMYALDPDDGNYWIYRLMIDQRYQRLGYGRKALLEMLKLMSKLPSCGHVTLSVVPENEMAMALYREVGFRATGEVIGGEVVFRHDLSAIG
ncbi:GNAT family N-acetyltransferase [Aminobacter sp. MDW-2]|uniref:GNAT family N-acetyltransferase n=1 Tax=Aminobacter sp. MDW-2 TaxID=2666139 RepID=UPI0012AEE94F|nr:GNAT family N-acetyltransferase [Aminobacter sp. MDW-2]MRX35129.1 GNAT family N-acetyltransferase [Aminobacter sp. MDW-2]QNH36072.1 GNAT family N-acetyltransferase [Aminobacter sp. MDW-2]